MLQLECGDQGQLLMGMFPLQSPELPSPFSDLVILLASLSPVVKGLLSCVLFLGAYPPTLCPSCLSTGEDFAPLSLGLFADHTLLLPQRKSFE